MDILSENDKKNIFRLQSSFLRIVIRSLGGGITGTVIFYLTILAMLQNAYNTAYVTGMALLFGLAYGFIVSLVLTVKNTGRGGLELFVCCIMTAFLTDEQKMENI